MEEFDVSFEQAIKNLDVPEPGKILRVKIVAINKEGVLVDLGLKSEGIIPITEFGQKGIPKNITVGREIPVILQSGKLEGYRIVSHKQARQKASWNKLQELFKNSEIINGVILERMSSGYLVDIGLDAFLPYTQVDKKNSDFSEGKEIKIMVVEVNEEDNSVVVSNRKVVDLERGKAIERVFSTVKVDDVLEGKVTKLVDFGAFVDIGGVDGLLHISDLAWHRVGKVGDILKSGDKVKVKVLKIDNENKKISLGLKQIMPHPWASVGKKYSEGAVVKGKVTSLTKFGAFVELEPGVEGLLHISEASWASREENLKGILKIGNEYEFKIIGLNTEEQKLSLSLKRLQVNPWDELKKKYPSGTKVKVKVTKMVPFGAFVMMPDGFEGLIHVEDMAWFRTNSNPKDMVKVGQEIEVVVLSIKPEIEKAQLSLKHLTEDPFEKYSIGKIVKGQVVRVLDFGVFVKLDNDIEAFLHKNDITREKVDTHTKDLIKMGQEIEAKVIRSDRKTRKIDISLKKLEIEEERKLIKKYSNLRKPQLGDILEEEK